ncbi:hypothetical protein [Streptomyces sp. WM6378]|uniref:hypothetical protein n=1 Tax=Streptomyces sp. WM6378 TaxID=1415557 RepID=UPI0006AEAACE|nr:hypothetical protein [Streptomyces sp. WM6378]KOU43616.1 hypothetical protein ADK54_17660 [Streptomyces sp. WM6378]
MLYERIFSTAHILAFGTTAFLFNASWHFAAHQDAPLWARLCAAVAAAHWARPVEAALARRHARRRAART